MMVDLFGLIILIIVLCCSMMCSFSSMTFVETIPIIGPRIGYMEPYFMTGMGCCILSLFFLAVLVVITSFLKF